MLLTVCNDMTTYLPDMFTSIKNQDYKVLLFPDGLLKEDSVLARMISDIPEEDWKLFLERTKNTSFLRARNE